jgi:hypothetical protein
VCNRFVRLLYLSIYCPRPGLQSKPNASVSIKLAILFQRHYVNAISITASIAFGTGGVIGYSRSIKAVQICSGNRNGMNHFIQIDYEYNKYSYLSTIGVIMQTALQIVTKVLPGNRIEVQIPSGSEGQEVNVFIVLPAEIPSAPPSNTNLLLQMSQDPEIQAELAAIGHEFETTQMDGLAV